MFTGLIEAVGSVRSARARGGGLDLVVAASFGGDLAEGDSIAVDGACLTIARRAAGEFEADVSGETMSVTTLGSLRVGTRVNLERAVQAGGRLGGHMVTGHVDGTGKIVRRALRGDYLEIVIEPNSALPGAVLTKGSIAVDGVSLTVASVESNRFAVVVIPETARRTTLADKPVACAVNLETDLVGKYVEHYLAAGSAAHTDQPARETGALRSLFHSAIEEGG